MMDALPVVSIKTLQGIQSTDLNQGGKITQWPAPCESGAVSKWVSV